MTPTESEAVKFEITKLTLRAELAERELKTVTAERDHLRALLTRSRTSLAEIFNDPAVQA